MANQHDSDRWGEIRGIHREYANFYRMLRGGVIIILIVFIGLSIYQEKKEPRAFGMNLWTEFAGIAVTVLIIDELNRRRAEDQRKMRLADSERQAEERYKRQLVDDAASTSNEIAKHAVHVMKRRGWLEGDTGLLQKADLRHANLNGAHLTRANFESAKLIATSLQDANLLHANLQAAKLFGSDMRRVDLKEANLRGADLSFVDLQGAKLVGADLRGANLTNANLEGAFVSIVITDHKTRLPNGRYYTEETDLQIFTDPLHPDFWQSKIAGSPAFKWRTRP